MPTVKAVPPIILLFLLLLRLLLREPLARVLCPGRIRKARLRLLPLRDRARHVAESRLAEPHVIERLRGRRPFREAVHEPLEHLLGLGPLVLPEPRDALEVRRVDRGV